jgi:hypothetical protein
VHQYIAGNQLTEHPLKWQRFHLQPENQYTGLVSLVTTTTTSIANYSMLKITEDLKHKLPQIMKNESGIILPLQCYNHLLEDYQYKK